MDLLEIGEGLKVLAIFAHPDDAETAAGGTLALYADNNSQVDVLLIAKGDKGRGKTSDRDIESKKASEILNINIYDSLDYADGEFDNDLKLRKTLTEKIRQHQPDIVICPDPTAVFFAHSYVNHRDHRETGWAVLDVVSSAVNNPKYFSDSKAHNVSHLLCAGTLEPNFAVDITKTLTKKIESVLCYESQIGNNSEATREAIDTTAKAIGSQVGVPYAEAFRYTSLAGSQY